MNTVIGPDISFYQDDPKTPQGVDFVKMQSASDFVIVRAGQNLWVDPRFISQWQQSKAAGIPRGSYWFYDSRADPKRQAELWVETMGADLGELPLFADLEERYSGDFSGWKHWYDFLERLKSLVGKKEIGIYTAFYYWRDHAPNPTTQAVNLSYFAQYPLWIANYGTDKPLVPQPWGDSDWLFWQFTEIGNGKAYGVETQGIDLNYFNGTLDQFKKRFAEGCVDTATPPAAPPPVAQKPPAKSPAYEATSRLFRVTAQILNLRTGPGTGFEIAGRLPIDTIVQGIRFTQAGNWVEVQTRDGSRGWCSSDYLQVIDSPKNATPFKVQLFDNVLFIREVFSKPRKVIANILFIDLQAESLEFLVTPSYGLQEHPLCSRTTSQFLTQFHAQIAINGDGFTQPPVETLRNPCANGGSPVKPNGLAASRGHVYATSATEHPTLFISRSNEMTFNTAPAEIYNAISGLEMLITKGTLNAGLSADSSLDARTALGVSRNGRWLCLVVADGRQPALSEGATRLEVANLLLRFGAYNAMTLDGGGSSAMVVEGFRGLPVTLNVPYDQTPGVQRPVANHLGIYLRKRRKHD